MINRETKKQKRERERAYEYFHFLWVFLFPVLCALSRYRKVTQ